MFCSAVKLLFEENRSAPTLIDVYQCDINTVGEAYKKNNLTEQWSELEPKLQKSIDTIKACKNIGNKTEIL